MWTCRGRGCLWHYYSITNALPKPSQRFISPPMINHLREGSENFPHSLFLIIRFIKDFVWNWKFAPDRKEREKEPVCVFLLKLSAGITLWLRLEQSEEQWGNVVSSNWRLGCTNFYHLLSEEFRVSSAFNSAVMFVCLHPCYVPPVAWSVIRSEIMPFISGLIRYYRTEKWYLLILENTQRIFAER